MCSVMCVCVSILCVSMCSVMCVCVCEYIVCEYGVCVV